jgi:hypothetical protein
MKLHSHERFFQKYKFYLLPIALMALMSPAQSQTAENSRSVFAEELARSLLGSEGVFHDAGADGWRGVLVAAPGTSIASISEAYNGFSGDFIKTTLFNSMFDRPVVLRNGYAVLAGRSISAIWADVLARTKPNHPSGSARVIRPEFAKWLFAEIRCAVPKKIAKSQKHSSHKRICYSNEPSRYVLKYRYYQTLYSFLLNTRAAGGWHEHPKLTKFSTFDDASNEILNEWIQYGYKDKVDIATQAFEAAQKESDWKTWTDAKARFNSGQILVDQYQRISQVLLFPPPSSWSEIGSWMRFQSKSDATAQSIRYQLARVKIERPWFQIEDLTTGRLKVDSADPKNGNFTLSDGNAPSTTILPNGELAAYVDELLLVRNIHTDTGGPITQSNHPLSVFSYPDSINLIGYIVRVPRYPRSVPAASADARGSLRSPASEVEGGAK